MPSTGCPLLLCPKAREIGSELPSHCSGIPGERASFRNREWEFSWRSNLGGTEPMPPCSSGPPTSCSPQTPPYCRQHYQTPHPNYTPRTLTQIFCLPLGIAWEWDARWIYKPFAFNCLEREVWLITRGGRRNGNHYIISNRLLLSIWKHLFTSFFGGWGGWVQFHFTAGFLKTVKPGWSGWLGISSRQWMA